MALVVGANLPDLDVLSYFRGADFALGFRRGWTHGVLALAILPLLLGGALWCWDRWRGGPADSRSLSTGWLFVLSYLAVLTHPALDWLNNYGMRWWMPFDNTWFYGDSVFIADPWLWLMLSVAWLIGRKPTGRLLLGWGIVAALVVWGVSGRVPEYQVILAIPLLGSLAALLWKLEPDSRQANRAATVGLVVAAVYILSLVGLHGITTTRVEYELAALGVDPVEQLMVGPLPADPSAWNVVVSSGGHYRTGRFSWWGRPSLELEGRILEDARASAQWRAIMASGQVDGFLAWVRFPWLEAEQGPHGTHVYLMDARYSRRRTHGFGGTAIELAE